VVVLPVQLKVVWPVATDARAAQTSKRAKLKRSVTTVPLSMVCESAGGCNRPNGVNVRTTARRLQARPDLFGFECLRKTCVGPRPFPSYDHPDPRHAIRRRIVRPYRRTVHSRHVPEPVVADLLARPRLHYARRRETIQRIVRVGAVAVFCEFPMDRTAVVFGAAGQLGSELVRALRARQYAVAAWDRSQVDIGNAAAVERALARSDPKLVFNAAAYNQVDIAEQEPQAAFLVNALAVRNLALACRQVDGRLVHYSTDHVFDGTARRPYTESDLPHPLSAYAVSKLAGELYAQAYLDNALIVRTSGVFGAGGLTTARGNFVELMLRRAASGQTIRVVEDYVSTPTYAPLLAERTLDLVERRLDGVFHIGGGTPVSWFEFAQSIFEIAGIQAPLLATNEREWRTPARRPKYSALSNAKMEQAGLAAMPPLRRALEDYFAARRP
jgi:dTDP-4-dehydrorhamnose reductase